MCSTSMYTVQCIKFVQYVHYFLQFVYVHCTVYTVRTSRGATSTFARGGQNYNFVIVWGGSPPFSKKFQNESAFLRV